MGFEKDHASAPKPAPTQAAPPNYTTATAGPSSAVLTRFASVSMHMQDTLRFLNFPEYVVGMCRTTIQGIWQRGIQAEREYGGSREIKVYGNPWRGMGDEAIKARRLICALLGTLHSQGWVLMLSTDISKKISDKDTLMFRHQVPPPVDCHWCCIGFSRTDRIKFIDGKCPLRHEVLGLSLVTVPPAVYDKFITCLGRSRVQDHSQHSPGVYEAKLHGSPWWANGTFTMEVRQLLLKLLEVLESEGWTVYASVDQKNGTDKQTETDTVGS